MKVFLGLLGMLLGLLSSGHVFGAVEQACPVLKKPIKVGVSLVLNNEQNKVKNAQEPQNMLRNKKQIAVDDLLVKDLLPPVIQRIVRQYVVDRADYVPAVTRLTEPSAMLSLYLARLCKPLQKRGDELIKKDLKTGYKRNVTVFARFNEVLAAGYSDGLLRVVYPDNTVVVAEGHSPVRSVAMAHDKTIGIGYQNKTAVIRYPDESYKILSGHEGPVISIAFGHDGLVATATAEGVVRVWQQDGTLKAVLWGQLDVKDIFIDSDSSVVTCTARNTVQVWERVQQLEDELFDCPLRLLSDLQKLLVWLQAQQAAAIATRVPSPVYVSDLFPVVVGSNDEEEFSESVVQKPLGVTSLPKNHLKTFIALPFGLQQNICQLFGCPAPAVLIQNSNAEAADGCSIQ